MRVCVCVFVFICVCVYAYAYVFMYTYECVCICVHVKRIYLCHKCLTDTNKPFWISTVTKIYLFLHILARMTNLAVHLQYSYDDKCVGFAYTRTHINTHASIDLHKYNYTHIFANMRALSLALAHLRARTLSHCFFLSHTHTSPCSHAFSISVTLLIHICDLAHIYLCDKQLNFLYVMWFMSSYV